MEDDSKIEPVSGILTGTKKTEEIQKVVTESGGEILTDAGERGERLKSFSEPYKEKVKREASVPIRSEETRQKIEQAKIAGAKITGEYLRRQAVQEKKETEKMYDVFFRDQFTGNPDRLHKPTGLGPRGKKDREPVILPPIPKAWIVKIPQDSEGNSDHYRQSNDVDTQEAINRLGLGKTATDRGIMIVDFVPKTEISTLEERGYKVVHIDQVRQESPKEEIEPSNLQRKTTPETVRIKRPEVKMPIGFSEVWEYDLKAPSGRNVRLIYRAEDLRDKKGVPLALPPLKELTADFSKHPILEVEIPEELREKPKEERYYYSPIKRKLMLARAQSEFRQVTNSEPTNVLLVTRVSPSSVKDKSRYERVIVNKALRTYQEAKLKRVA